MQRVNIQVVEHILNRHLAVELLKHQHILPVVTVKGDAPCTPVVGNAANLPRVMLFKNSPGLAHSAGTVQIGHFQLSVFGTVFFRKDGLPQQFNVPDTESKIGMFFKNFHGGFAGTQFLHKLKHFRRFVLAVCRELAPLRKGAGYRGFHLVCIGPNACFGNVLFVFSRCAVCPFNMRRWKPLFDGGKAHR